MEPFGIRDTASEFRTVPKNSGRLATLHIGQFESQYSRQATESNIHVFLVQTSLGQVQVQKVNLSHMCHAVKIVTMHKMYVISVCSHWVISAKKQKYTPSIILKSKNNKQDITETSPKCSRMHQNEY